MTDNQLILAFRPLILAGLISAGYTNVPVIQAYQPTQQGVISTPAVFYHKISDQRYGFLERKDSYDELNELFIHEENQWYETTFQIMALSIQNPVDLTLPTAADLVNLTAGIMQSDVTRLALKAQGVGILRVQEIRNPYFIDDKGRYEASPSFDFVLTHVQRVVSAQPVVTGVDVGIYRI